SGALGAVKQALAEVAHSTSALPALQSASDLLESAAIQIEEALAEINARADTVHIDPQRLQQVEHRLDEIYAIARKHNLQPEQLAEHHMQLAGELAALENSDETIATLEQELQQQLECYSKKAGALSRKRKSAAKKLAAAVGEKLAELKMEHCKFAVDLAAHEPTTCSQQGLESIEFLIATVPGKPPQPLAKIASGGELSRISLAIQVVTAQTSDTPTLVFDEVDVGIGGGVAEVVGNLLRELGANCQVFCVTHLAQVAAKGSQHLLVTKHISSSSATTQIEAMDKAARKAELARMLGGLDVTASTIAHANEILESA
ncbi:MAG: DNA repair protein RecN, partial [Pseudomonadales bacterium]|nr:DNA repair protein RecN [Pseudomonadales bacterium]